MNHQGKSVRQSRLVRVLVFGVALWLLAGWFFPESFTRLYDSAYGERLHRYPLERWLKQWNSIWSRVLIVGGTITVGWLAAHSPRVRAWADRRAPLPAMPTTATAGVRSRRPFYVLGTVIVLGQFIDITIGREHWPFSHFPMYTGIQTADYARSRVDGVLADGTEVSLTQYFVPLSPGKVHAVIQNHGRHSPEEHFQRCAQEYFDWYQFSRSAGRHHGPPIVAARVYELNWRLREDAANIDEPEKVLLAEYGEER